MHWTNGVTFHSQGKRLMTGKRVTRKTDHRTSVNYKGKATETTLSTLTQTGDCNGRVPQGGWPSYDMYE